MIDVLHNFFRRHLSDEELVLLVTSDLSSRQQARADQHMAVCSECCTRRARFEGLYSQALAYHACGVMVHSLEDPVRRARLAAQLNQMPDDEPDTEGVRAEKAKHGVGAFLLMNPILVTGLVLAVASITCIFWWMQQSRPDITSNTLLVRAEAWDLAGVRDSSPGVIRQTVSITTQNQTLRHTIYRDAKGRRRLREQRLAEGEDRLKRKLAEAQISWEAPLSATSYQDWHDAQRVREDHIRRVSGDQLVLTTTTPNGIVAAQSLTVRDTDFHPVRRTVSFRGSATVEIAELDYSVLPWTPEVRGLFEPEDEMRAASPAKPLPTLVLLPPPVLTEESLNEAELSTRLTLNRLRADTGEQIELTRGAAGIEVSGITDTEKRKHELEAELNMLPHVTASISSIEELKTKQPGSDDSSSVKVIEMQTQTTPLEIYYLAHGRRVASIGDLAQELFNTAFAINLESRAIDDLQRRFSHDEEISTIASATLTDLLFTHKRKLLTALEDERQLLVDAQIDIPAAKDAISTNSTSATLAPLSERNLTLTKELALSKGAGGRSAEMIASELTVSIHELSYRARAVQVMPQSSTKMDKRK